MDTTYRFLSDTEPTEEQLAGLMQAVSQDVKERASKAAEKYREHQQQQIRLAKEAWQAIQQENGRK